MAALRAWSPTSGYPFASLLVICRISHLLSRCLAGISLGACLAFSAPLTATELLLEAAKNNKPEEAARLLTLGADPNERGQERATPLHWASFHGNESMAKGLIAAGAKVDTRLANGSTPLHLAAYKGNTSVVRLLLEYGADASASNNEGITPLDWARRNGHQDTEAVLTGGRTLANPTASEPPSPRIAPEPAPTSDVARQQSRPGGHRIQLAAVSSEERARRAIAIYRERFADILREVELTVDTTNGPDGPLYRVQSGPVTSTRAKTLCDQFGRRNQPCLIRSIIQR